MENIMDQNANPATGQGTGERTFSQDDVNRIVQERLAKEKAKGNNEAEFAKREQELAQRELLLNAKEVLSEKSLPVQLLDALNCTDKETMEKSISIIETIFNEYKANATNRPYGATPAQSQSTRYVYGEQVSDPNIRKAMGLR